MSIVRPIQFFDRANERGFLASCQTQFSAQNAGIDAKCCQFIRVKVAGRRAEIKKAGYPYPAPSFMELCVRQRTRGVETAPRRQKLQLGVRIFFVRNADIITSLVRTMARIVRRADIAAGTSPIDQGKARVFRAGAGNIRGRGIPESTLTGIGILWNHQREAEAKHDSDCQK